MILGLNPSGDEIFSTSPHCPLKAHSVFCVVGNGALPGSKAARADHWPSSTKGKERVELYLCLHSMPSWNVVGWTVPLFLPLHAVLYVDVHLSHACTCPYTNTHTHGTRVYSCGLFQQVFFASYEVQTHVVGHPCWWHIWTYAHTILTTTGWIIHLSKYSAWVETL
jgi:hypothetical protein